MAQLTVWQQIFDYANRADPYPLYAELRKTPVAQQEDGSYAVSTYWEIVSLLHDPRVSSDPAERPAPSSGLSEAAARVPPFISTDPPVHDRLRRLATRYFGPPNAPKRVDGMRPELQRQVNGLLDRMAGRDKIDVVDDFAYPFPVTVICDLLGVPAEDEVQFHDWATAVTDSFDLAFESDAAEVERRAALTAQARIELGQYLAALVGKYSQAPVDNFMSGLVMDDGPEGRMSQGDTLATAVMLLIAGHETTVNLITNGVLTLLRHQDVLERLGREPELMIGTVEELLRYEPPVHMLPNRSALTDIAIAGTTIPKGSALTLVLAAASRDPNRFSDPDRFDPDRNDNQHLGFGSGIHNCFGAPMARLEVQIALSEIIRRLDNPRLVADPPPYRHSPILRGPRHLMIEVDGIRSG